MSVSVNMRCVCNACGDPMKLKKKTTRQFTWDRWFSFFVLVFFSCAFFVPCSILFWFHTHCATLTQVNWFVAHSYADYRTQFACILETNRNDTHDKTDEKKTEKKLCSQQFTELLFDTLTERARRVRKHTRIDLHNFNIWSKSQESVWCAFFSCVLYFVTAATAGHTIPSSSSSSVVCIRECCFTSDSLICVLTMLVRCSGLTGCSFSFVRFDLLCGAERCWPFWYFIFLSVHSTSTL